jgi:hypothetical protein
MSVSLSMALAAEVYRAEGQFRRFKINIKKTEISSISI